MLVGNFRLDIHFEVAITQGSSIKLRNISFSHCNLKELAKSELHCTSRIHSKGLFWRQSPSLNFRDAFSTTIVCPTRSSISIKSVSQEAPHVFLTILWTFFLLFSDPFADAAKGGENDVQDGLVHIRIQQRNGRKTLTTIQGLSSEYDLKKILRACKKVCTLSR